MNLLSNRGKSTYAVMFEVMMQNVPLHQLRGNCSGTKIRRSNGVNVWH